MKVAVVKETAPGERRVALVPEMIARLRGAGLEILVESGRGERRLVRGQRLRGGRCDRGQPARNCSPSADLILTVGQPDEQILGGLRSGQAIMGMLNPLADPGLAATLAPAG